MSNESVTIGTYLQFLQLKVKFIYVNKYNEAPLPSIAPEEPPQPHSKVVMINVPPSLRLADICPQIGTFATDADGNLFHPDTNIFDYIRTTGGDIYTRDPNAFAINCEPKRAFKVPPALAKVNPHRFLFAVQQYFHKELSIGCRVVIDDSALSAIRRAGDTLELIYMLKGAIPVELMYPQATKIKLHNLSTINLDTSSYYWSDNVFLLSDDFIEKLEKLVGLYESPEKRKSRELALTVNRLRHILSAEEMGDDLLGISDDQAFMAEFIKEFIREEETAPIFNPRTIRAINAVNDRIGDMGHLVLTMARRACRVFFLAAAKLYQLAASLVRFLFANELAALFIYLAFTCIMLTSARRGNVCLFGLLSGIAVLFTATAVLRVRYNVDLTAVIVKRTFPEVYPTDIASAELEKNVQQLCVISDVTRRSAAISKQIDAMRRYPNVLKAINVCVLGTVPSLILAWREEIEKRRASLTSIVCNAVDQELQRREAASGATSNDAAPHEIPPSMD